MTHAPTARRPAAGTAVLPPVLASVALYAVFGAMFLSRQHFDASAFSCVTLEHIGRSPFSDVTTGFASGGYDGQFYYAIAQHPLGVNREGVDAPAGRQLRGLYPALCWCCSAGNGRALNWAMPLVNLLGIGVTVLFAARFAVHNGVSRWWGLTLPVATSVALPFVRNLTDVVAMAGLVAFVTTALSGGGVGWMCLWGTVAVLAREQNLLFLGVVVVAGRPARRSRQIAVAVAVSATVWAAWFAYLAVIYKAVPTIPAGGNFALPGVGLWAGLRRVRLTPKTILQAVAIAMLLVNGVMAAAMVRRRELSRLRLLLAAAVGLALVGGPAIYASPWSSLRVFAPLPALVWLSLVSLRRPDLSLVQVPVGLVSLAALFSEMGTTVGP